MRLCFSLYQKFVQVVKFVEAFRIFQQKISSSFFNYRHKKRGGAHSKLSHVPRFQCLESRYTTISSTRSTDAATISSTAPATISSTAPATRSSTAPATISSTAPATRSSTAPATRSSTQETRRYIHRKLSHIPRFQCW